MPSAPIDGTPRGGCLPFFGLLLAAGGVALAIYTWGLPEGSHSGGDLLFRKAMSVVIAGIGIVLFAMGRYDNRGARVSAALAARHPGAPWFWRDDWEQGFARPEAVSQAAQWLAIGALLLLLSVPIGLEFPAEVIRKGNYPALLALAFPIVGLWMLAKSGVSWVRDRKFADTRLVFSGIPVALGGRLIGRVDGAFRMPANSQVHLVLSCMRSYVSGQGTDRPRWTQVLWQDKNVMTAAPGGAETTSIPVAFDIPYDGRATDASNPDDEIFWRLSAVTDLPGLDLRCEFRVPVFQTAAGNKSQTVASLDARARSLLVAQPGDSEIERHPSSTGGASYHVRAARHKGIATAVTIFGLLSLGSGVFVGYAVGKMLWWGIGLLPAMLFGGVGLLLLAVGFGLWFGATTVEVVGGDLHIRRTYLIFSRSLVLRRDEVRAFDLHPGMQQGEQVWYELRAQLANGRRRTVCGGMEKSEAEWFRGEIQKAMAI